MTHTDPDGRATLNQPDASWQPNQDMSGAMYYEFSDRDFLDRLRFIAAYGKENVLTVELVNKVLGAEYFKPSALTNQNGGNYSLTSGYLGNVAGGPGTPIPSGPNPTIDPLEPVGSDINGVAGTLAHHEPWKLDINAFTKYLDDHAEDSSVAKCAGYVRRGLEAGGLDTEGRPGDAKDYGPFLSGKGASVVSQNGYEPRKGDLAVFGGNDSHPYGHIQGYTGEHWVSDFIQSRFSPYLTATPPSTIYRFPQ